MEHLWPELFRRTLGKTEPETLEEIDSGHPSSPAVGLIIRVQPANWTALAPIARLDMRFVLHQSQPAISLRQQESCTTTALKTLRSFLSEAHCSECTEWTATAKEDGDGEEVEEVEEVLDYPDDHWMRYFAARVPGDTNP